MVKTSWGAAHIVYHSLRYNAAMVPADECLENSPVFDVKFKSINQAVWNDECGQYAYVWAFFPFGWLGNERHSSLLNGGL